ncbi:MAG TPA: M48 family metalloprotease [Oculatellaceae cyanobacterium]
MRHLHTSLEDQKPAAIRRRLIETWLKTLVGYLGMGALVLGAFKLFGSTYHLQLGFGLLWILLPIPMWWFSAKIALAMTKSVPADPNNPEHKRLIDIVHRTWLKSGLKHEPPVYVSDNPLPNAFATGPIHSQAVVAATKGLFLIGLTDDEIEAVFAHELGHVRNYDVGINSMLAMMSSLFFLIVDGGVRMLLGSIGFFKRTLGIKPKAKGEPQGFFITLSGIVMNIVLYLVFWLTGQMTKVIQMFVTRSRESGADATGAWMTKNPCALATALEKLVAYVEKNRPQGQEKELLRALRPIMTIDPLYDAVEPDPKPANLWQRLQAFWKWLMLSHPTVPDRVYQLERMNGGTCPRPNTTKA